jgi:hypothetical protein
VESRNSYCTHDAIEYTTWFVGCLGLLANFCQSREVESIGRSVSYLYMYMNRENDDESRLGRFW